MKSTVGVPGADPPVVQRRFQEHKPEGVPLQIVVISVPCRIFVEDPRQGVSPGVIFRSKDPAVPDECVSLPPFLEEDREPIPLSGIHEKIHLPSEDVREHDGEFRTFPELRDHGFVQRRGDRARNAPGDLVQRGFLMAYGQLPLLFLHNKDAFFVRKILESIDRAGRIEERGVHIAGMTAPEIEGLPKYADKVDHLGI